MKTRPLTPVGAVVTELDLQHADVPGLRALLAEHGVLVLPGQHVSDQVFTDFLSGFGELVFTTGETPVDGFPDLNVISNVGRTTPPRSTFHADTTYVRQPPAYTALRAVDIPEQGGETVFTNQYNAFDTLDAHLRNHLEGRSMTHVVTGLELGPDDEQQADHPVFRRHPLSGRTALFMTTPARCRAIRGLEGDETTAVVESLFAHSTREENCYRHAWSPGDVVMWDNGCVLHRADHEGVVGDRVMHRGMVGSYGIA